jgi:exosortase family protein XrtM
MVRFMASKSIKTEIRFFLLFILFFILLQSLYTLTRPYTTDLIVYRLSAGISSSAINWMTPEEETTHEYDLILSKKEPVVLIGQSCDGMVGLLLLVCAMLAFPSGWKRKGLGVLISIPCLTLINILRIMTLYYLYKYHRGSAQLVHLYVWQPVYIFSAVLFFFIWIPRTGSNR